jgi:hypothetical protein
MPDARCPKTDDGLMGLIGGALVTGVGVDQAGFVELLKLTQHYMREPYLPDTSPSPVASLPGELNSLDWRASFLLI